jgi:hypothetical protein
MHGLSDNEKMHYIPEERFGIYVVVNPSVIIIL